MDDDDVVVHTIASAFRTKFGEAAIRVAESQEACAADGSRETWRSVVALLREPETCL